MNHLFEIDSCYWYAAETAEEARTMYLAELGESPEDGYGNDVVQLPDDKSLTVADPDNVIGETTTKLASEWAETKGFVATTEY